MTNPIDDIENKQGNKDMGRLAVQVFKGAREEANTWLEAFWATMAFFAGMMKAGQEPPEDNE